MNLWLYIPAFAALFAGASVFALCPVLRRFHKFMGFTFIFEGLTFLMNVTLFLRAGSFHQPSYLLNMVMMLVIPAFYYLAVQALLREEEIRGRDLWMFQTALVFAIIYLPVVSVILPVDKEIFFRIQQGYPVYPTIGASVLIALDKTAFGLFLVEYLFIQIFCIINLSGYIRSLENYYSDLDGRTIFPVAAILTLMGIRFLMMAVSAFVPVEITADWLPVGQALVSVLFYSTVAYFVCHVRYTSEELGKMAEVQAERLKTPVANDVIESRLCKLEGEKFYLERNVNLIDVASRIGVNSKYVSEYLRFHFGETFMSYVNRLRVEASTEYLKKENMTLEEVADNVGYDNVSTFYRNFTKIKGVSPSKYREM